MIAVFDVQGDRFVTRPQNAAHMVVSGGLCNDGVIAIAIHDVKRVDGIDIAHDSTYIIIMGLNGTSKTTTTNCQTIKAAFAVTMYNSSSSCSN